MSFPIAATTAEIDRIASLAEPVLRNLQITQCYAELSAAFAKRMGPKPTGAALQPGHPNKRDKLSANRI